MSNEYPQEHIGTTLLSVNESGECRRVYMRQKPSYLEVGEFTRGPLTQELYDAPAHVHSIHLESVDMEQDVAAFFKEGEPFLADCMDWLDANKVAYGYLNSTAGGHVTYRPATVK